jgi:Mg-chelatase subunit ChlD
MDLSKLMVENLDTEGQTALGPALALALGISSVHDIGSRIIMISDALPNIGILSP